MTKHKKRFLSALLVIGSLAGGASIALRAPKGPKILPAQVSGSYQDDDFRITKACGSSILAKFPIQDQDRHKHTQEASVWRLPDGKEFFFISGMTIDADGSPNAYNPSNTGLDDLSNAGAPGHWDGIVTGPNGEPLIQGKNDPFPGYYVSATSLFDSTKTYSDPTAYVDASKIPYIVLPDAVANQGGARLGDFGVVVNLQNGKSSDAIFVDQGTFGEGSIALANNLGIPSDAREGGQQGGMLYLVFPGSGNQQPRTTQDIINETDKLLRNWGGIEKLASCTALVSPQRPASPQNSTMPGQILPAAP